MSTKNYTRLYNSVKVECITQCEEQTLKRTIVDRKNSKVAANLTKIMNQSSRITSTDYSENKCSSGNFKDRIS